MATRKQLRDIDTAAMYWVGEAPKPEASAQYDGHTFSVKYNEVKRKCFDGFVTPTALYKVDGKRVSRAVFYGMAD